MNSKLLKVQGIKVNYYCVCKRKLWLFSKGITMEQNSNRVLSGKVIHESSYPRMKKKEVLVDDLLKLDIVDGEYIREVKMSSKMSKADRMQLLYYLYYLKQKGIEKKGLVNYVKEKKIEEIELTAKDEKEIEKVLKEINKVVTAKTAPKVKKLFYCKKCAYYELCYIEEE
ncbi:CRISPR-associated protein Cas4 [Sporohalobacter salinus]|uniref:CRISPR-associated protein Cas4 n=1 Tax=Sporohalobacter salinus TaxID=1494606 RepID=UPI0019617CFA|nr:CRISPR-associated exonuclease Cas4 [Sporohalobacter salinus]